jgi:hypothetical protein
MVIMNSQQETDIAIPEPETHFSEGFDFVEGEDSGGGISIDRRANLEACPDCGKEYLPEIFTIGSKELFRQMRCWPCQDTYNREIIEKERRKKIMEQFLTICPPLYRDTDPAKLPPAFQLAVKTWTYAPTGIGLVGAPGTGKTRAVYLILQRMIEQDKSCQALNATGLASLVAEQFSDDPSTKFLAAEKLRKARSVEVLLIDDLGKNKMTERAEMELYDILEHRTSYMLPTLWTSNSKSKELIAMMTSDRAGAIIRRLKDFSTIYNP